MSLVVVIALLVIFLPKYDGSELNCVFITEKANLHGEYYVTVKDAYESDNIFIYKNIENTEKSEIIETSNHFLSAAIIIEHQQMSNPKENHPFDVDDFKNKDHTRVQIGNINLFLNENGLALETTNFSTSKPVADYFWLGKEVICGESLEFTLYYELSKTLSIYNDVMVLETDFLSRLSGNKIATMLS